MININFEGLICGHYDGTTKTFCCKPAVWKSKRTPCYYYCDGCKERKLSLRYDLTEAYFLKL